MSYISDDNMGQFLFTPPNEFDPIKHARFRGKPLPELGREELLEALVQALKEVRKLYQQMG
jgi:hypothetical protein